MDADEPTAQVGDAADNPRPGRAAGNVTMTAGERMGDLTLRFEADSLGRWLGAHAVAMLGAVAATVLLLTGTWVALVGFASFGIVCYLHRRPLAALGPFGGAANRLTALRLGLVLAAAAFVNDLPKAWFLTLLAANVVIDAADGYVARRAHQVTEFGAVFDREADAVFVLVAYLYFVVAREFSPWWLVPGALPYLYRLAARTRARVPAPDHRERFAPLLAGANYVVLLVAVAAPAGLQLYVLLASVGVVASSFLMSFRSLFRNEHSFS
jgi:phosphatidylglycerophosphate synthase